MLFGRRGKSINDIKAVLKGYLDNIGEAEPGEDGPEAIASAAQRDILTGLIGFLEGC